MVEDFKKSVRVEDLDYHPKSWDELKKDLEDEWHRWDVEALKQMDSEVELFNRLRRKKIFDRGDVVHEICRTLRKQREELHARLNSNKTAGRTARRYMVRHREKDGDSRDTVVVVTVDIQ